jgi:hypothetical protein
MSGVWTWLAELGCEQYAAIMEGSGYTTVESLGSLDDARLQSLGVFDANHRRSIMHKVAAVSEADLDSVLTDLTSVIADLEAFTVPSKISTFTNTSTPQGQRRSMLQREDPRPPPPDQDFDLDSLLLDLTSFNPSETVAARNPPPPPPRRDFPQASPSHSSHSSHSTPVHNHSTPTPPSTPGHGSGIPHSRPPQILRSNTEDFIERPRPQASSRSRSISSPTHERPIEQGLTSPSLLHDKPLHVTPADPVVVKVPQPELAGATDLISQEETSRRLHSKAQELRSDHTLTEEEREERMKQEKMKIGIEKMKLAHKKKVAIKVFNVDRSNKTVVVEEGMTASMVCHLLVVKNHFDESPNWVLLEQLGDVSLERELEDHEQVVDVYSSWPREHTNVFLFKQNDKKYDLFEDPIKYFPQHLKTSVAAIAKVTTLERAEKARKILLQEYFSSTSRVPELEGWLNLKDGFKKSWKKVFFILRASGLYYSTKGKQKGAKFLQLLVQFEEYELYHGINFKKVVKAPTEFCFGLRPLPRQFVPGPKDIKVLCSDDEATALSWTAGIRLAKYGLQLRDNFHKAKLTQFKLEDLGAPEGSKPKADDRVSKLVGFRLEKHMDKIREQYNAHREEEEIKKQLYHSPHSARRGSQSEGEDVDENHSTSNTPPSTNTPERTPEPPAPRNQPPPVAPRPGTSPKPTPAPRPPKRSDVQVTPQSSGPPQPPAPYRPPQPPAPYSESPPQPPAPYNPYPAPNQPAPPPRSVCVCVRACACGVEEPII